MSHILAEQLFKQRLRTVLSLPKLSDENKDICITIYTDNDCIETVKNVFSVQRRRISRPPIGDLKVHLYNEDIDLYFTKRGELLRVTENPDHSAYAERCACRNYYPPQKDQNEHKCLLPGCQTLFNCPASVEATCNYVSRSVRAQIEMARTRKICNCMQSSQILK